MPKKKASPKPPADPWGTGGLQPSEYSRKIAAEWLAHNPGAPYVYLPMSEVEIQVRIKHAKEQAKIAAEKSRQLRGRTHG